MSSILGRQHGFFGERFALAEMLPAKGDERRPVRFFNIRGRFTSTAEDGEVICLRVNGPRLLLGWMKVTLLGHLWRWAEAAELELRALACEFFFGRRPHEELNLSGRAIDYEAGKGVDGFIPEYLLADVLREIAASWRSAIERARILVARPLPELLSSLASVFAAGGKSSDFAPLS